MKIVGRTETNAVIGEPASTNERTSVTFLPRASDCRLDIGPDCRLDNVEITFNHANQHVRLAGGNAFAGQIFLHGRDCKVVFGARTKANGFLWMNLSEAGTSVLIGEDCLLSSVKFRTSDSHKIFDVETGDRVNPPGDIVVCDNVWIADEVLLLKGAHVGAGTVVGTRSLVNGALPANSLCVGSPARVVRQNIRWEE